LVHNNTKLIKNVLVSYHEEQIKFITKLFDNALIQQLFSNVIPDNIQNNDQLTETNQTNETNESNEVSDKNDMTTNVSTENHNLNATTTSKLMNFFQNFNKKSVNADEHVSKTTEFLQRFEKKNAYPELPKSPKADDS